MTLKDTLKKALVDTLEITRGNQQEAAKLLGISARRMNYQMMRLGIPRRIDKRRHETTWRGSEEDRATSG